MRLNFGYLYKLIKLHFFFFLFFIKKQKITDYKKPAGLLFSLNVGSVGLLDQQINLVSPSFQIPQSLSQLSQRKLKSKAMLR